MRPYAYYQRKSEAELEFIKDDAAEAAEAMREVDAEARLKYLEQAKAAERVLAERRGLLRSRAIRRSFG